MKANRRVVKVDGRNANRRVVMTCAGEGAETFATADLCDRAHDVRDCDGKLVSAARIQAHSTPRRYPRMYMHEVVESSLGVVGDEVRVVERAVAVVSDETVFDETFELQRRLAAIGLDVFGRGVAAEAVREAVMRHPRNRDLLPRRERSR